jgi:hypothetical protein
VISGALGLLWMMRTVLAGSVLRGAKPGEAGSIRAAAHRS